VLVVVLWGLRLENTPSVFRSFLPHQTLHYTSRRSCASAQRLHPSSPSHARPPCSGLGVHCHFPVSPQPYPPSLPAAARSLGTYTTAASAFLSLRRPLLAPRRPIGVTATAAIGVDLCIGRTPTHPRAPGAFSDRGSYRGIGQRKTLEGKRRQLYFLHHSISSHASDPLTVLLSWPPRRSIDLLPSVARSDWSLP
jgi:hypothetical protein